jgi:hypothetical protein
MVRIAIHSAAAQLLNFSVDLNFWAQGELQNDGIAFEFCIETSTHDPTPRKEPIKRRCEFGVFRTFTAWRGSSRQSQGLGGENSPGTWCWVRLRWRHARRGMAGCWVGSRASAQQPYCSDGAGSFVIAPSFR